MGWRDALDVRDQYMSETPFDGLERLVPGEIRLVATPRQWVDEFGQWNKGPWAMVGHDRGVHDRAHTPAERESVS